MSTWLLGAYGPDMDGSARGITRLRSRDDGALEVEPGWLIEAPSPAFLARSGTSLLAALEGYSSIARFAQEAASPRAEIASGASYPCHIGVYGSTAIVSNYSTGVLGVIDTEAWTVATVDAVPGSGPHPSQQGPHAHATALVAPGVVLSADLGADRIHVYRLANGALSLTSSIALRPGFGPRDLLVTSDASAAPRVYVLGEHGLSVVVARWTGTTLDIVGETPLPGAVPGDQAAALGVRDTHLYAGVRGSNVIAVLGIEGDSLAPIASVATGGDWPRHLVVDGRFLHVANQRSDSVASFVLGPDGIPQAIAEPVFVASPTHLLAD